MIRSFILAALMLFAIPALAQNVSTEGLNEAQVAAIKAETARLAAENAANKSPGAILGNAAGWGKQAADAAEGFARAIGVAARELNVTVNEFLATPAGMLTAGLIIWKVGGTSLMGLVYGLIFITAGFIVIRAIYYRLFTDRFELVDYDRFWGLWKGKTTIRVTRGVKDFKSDGDWLVFWVVVLGSLGVLGLGAAIIF